MKKLFALVIALLMLCACGAEELPAEVPNDIPKESSGELSEEVPENAEKTENEEKVVFTIGEKDYEVNAAKGTVITDNGNGSFQIDVPSLAEGMDADLSALFGCEDITELYLYFQADAKEIIIPKMPNLEFLNIFGTTAETIDISALEGTPSVHFNIHPNELKIGKGPEKLLVDYAFELSKLAGAENVKSITVYGDNDLSLIADIGEVEEVYIIGEETNIGELENLKSLKRLSIYAMDPDFSPLENLTVESLVISDVCTHSFIESFTYSETITEIQINDEILEDAAFIEKMPNLKKILLNVDPVQDESAILWNEAPLEKEAIDLLNTNIPKEQLKAFAEKGGEIYLIPDLWRNN